MSITLLDKAKKIPLRYNKIVDINREKLELVIAYLNEEITMKQFQAVIEGNSYNGVAYVMLKWIRQAVKDNIIEIKLRDKE